MENANPFETLRTIISLVGLWVDFRAWRRAKQRRVALVANRSVRVGRGHIMARSNVQSAFLAACLHLALGYVAFTGMMTPESPGPMTWLSFVSNIGQALASSLAALSSFLVANAQEDADILDERNSAVDDVRVVLMAALDALPAKTASAVFSLIEQTYPPPHSQEERHG